MSITDTPDKQSKQAEIIERITQILHRASYEEVNMILYFSVSITRSREVWEHRKKKTPVTTVTSIQK